MSRLKKKVDAPDTPSHMLDVAEQRFAERGLDNVSLREIVRHSGQSNLSAAHYHFGSREGLIAALLTRRMRVIDLLRNDRLDALNAYSLASDVLSIVQQSVAPLAEVVKSTTWGADYVRVAAQVLLNPSAAYMARVEPEAKQGLLRSSRMLRQLLPGLANDVFEDRMRIVNNESVYSIARWVYTNGRVTAASEARFDKLVLHTTEFLAAGLSCRSGVPAGSLRLSEELSA